MSQVDGVQRCLECSVSTMVAPLASNRNRFPAHSDRFQQIDRQREQLPLREAGFLRQTPKSFYRVLAERYRKGDPHDRLREMFIGFLASSCNSKNGHLPIFVEDGVNDPPGADSDSMKILLEFFDSKRARIGSKGPGGGIDGFKDRLGELIEFLLSRSVERDLVAHAAWRMRRLRYRS